jgi:hypothetical protein
MRVRGSACLHPETEATCIYKHASSESESQVQQQRRQNNADLRVFFNTDSIIKTCMARASGHCEYVVVPISSERSQCLCFTGFAGECDIVSFLPVIEQGGVVITTVKPGLLSCHEGSSAHN